MTRMEAAAGSNVLWVRLLYTTRDKSRVVLPPQYLLALLANLHNDLNLQILINTFGFESVA